MQDNVEFRKYSYAVHVKTGRLYLGTDLSVHAFEAGVPLERAGKHFLDMQMSSSFFAGDDDVKLIAYRHGARLVHLHRKEGKDEVLKKYSYALYHEKVIVAVQVDEDTQTIRYAVGRPRSRPDEYLFLSFTDYMTYRQWFDSLPEHARGTWSPVAVSFEGLVRIARKHGTILRLDDLRCYFTGETLKEIASHEKIKKGNEQEIEK